MSKHLHPDVKRNVVLYDADGTHTEPAEIAEYFSKEFSNNNVSIIGNGGTLDGKLTAQQDYRNLPVTWSIFSIHDFLVCRALYYQRNTAAAWPWRDTMNFIQ